MKKYISPLLLLGAAMIWGFAFAAQDAASEVPPFALGFSRSIMATLFLIPVIVIFDRIGGSGRRLVSRRGIDLNRYELFGGMVLGAVLAAASAFQQFGINSGTDGGKAAFITAMYVVLVPIYALALRKKAPVNVWISVAIAAVGFYFLCIRDGFSMVPSDILVLMCSLIFPIHILVIDRLSPLCDGIRMSMVQFASCAAVNLILSLITEGGTHAAEAVFANLGAVVFLGVGSSGIAYTLQIIGQKGVNPAAASIILSLESVFGVLGTALLLHSKLEMREYIGCAIVFLAVILSQLEFPSRKEKNAQQI